ncbi:hypothetical protein [Leucobacter massiliensis]|uniref:Uncharacterized protein n=1 Tax=Leucobacter massiliensis TaxID=1686285 RepID=A0A2S9QSP6_9MICO|nr:hypothetical protein [Leucobacter massiliensis]PRI12615.1 hypothetical protein B4915_00695 [Leucobacter massiliensis]
MSESKLSSDAQHSDSSEQSRPLFAQALRPQVSAGSVVIYVIVMALLLGGFYLLASAFSVAVGTWLFVGGLAAVTLAFWIAFGLVSSLDRAD